MKKNDLLRTIVSVTALFIHRKMPGLELMITKLLKNIPLPAPPRTKLLRPVYRAIEYLVVMFDLRLDLKMCCTIKALSITKDLILEDIYTLLGNIITAAHATGHWDLYYISLCIKGILFVEMPEWFHLLMPFLHAFIFIRLWMSARKRRPAF